MIQIERLFYNLFREKDIRPMRLQQFAKEHLAVLKQQNPSGIFDLIISQTEALIQSMQTASHQKYAYLGNRKGQAQSKRLIRQTIINYVRQKEGLIKNTFGEVSAEYIKFFPNGLTALYTKTDNSFGLLVFNIWQRANQYESQLGTAFKTEMAALLEQWKQKSGELTATKAEVSGKRSEVKNYFEQLGTQLTTNAYTVALAFINQPHKANVYFDQHLLLPANRRRIFKGSAQPLEIITAAQFKYSPGKRLSIKNKGAEPFTIQMLLDQTPVGQPVNIPPGTVWRQRFDSLFSSGTALQLTNPANTPALYQISILA